MQRGFLNTQKAKRRTAEAQKSESSGYKGRKRDGPGTERVGVDLPTLDPHKPPECVQTQGESKNRTIFRVWPRDPKGQKMLPSPLRGKEAGNGLDLWGATLYDFYYVHRIPDMIHYMTTSTGSKLAKWMRQAGELIAEDEIAWADKEDDPKEIPVVNIGELIKCRDLRVSLGIYDRLSSRKEVRERAEGKLSLSPDQHAPQDAAAEAEEGSIPQVNNQGDGAEKSATASARLDEPMPVEKIGDKSTAKDTDESAVSTSQHNDPIQVEETGDKSSPKDTHESAVSLSQHDEPMQVGEIGDKSLEKDTHEPAVSASKYDSPFNPAYYPSPWPFIPCTHDDDDTPLILQQRLPLHLLPEKLHVHDPWNRLSINEGNIDADDDDTESGSQSQSETGSDTVSWLTKVTEGGDIIRTYSLSLSTEGKQAALASREKAELAEDEAAAKEKVIRIFPAEREGPTNEPLIEVVLPPRPRKRTQVEEAHLYIAPPTMGQGHHSFVYFAEWELPRDVFMEAHLCHTCVERDARKQLQELKDQGKWEELLKDLIEKRQASGLDISPGPGPSHANPKQTVGHITIEEHQLPHETVSFLSATDALHLADPHSTGDDLAADVIASEAGPAMSTASDAIETGAEADTKMDVVEGQHVEPRDEGDSKESNAKGFTPEGGKGKGKEILEQDNEDEEEATKEQSEEEQNEEEQSEGGTFTIQPPRIVRVAAYAGPALRIYTAVRWQDPTGIGCGHGYIGSSNPVPRTATVGVAAKLSFEHDAHLEREARNYQLFPSHFFEHWNGYNVIPPLKAPVPVGALCPQFYGYYTPDDPTDGTSRPYYLSPILLLEHCGSQVVPATFNEDDREECASLLFRFHHAGWLHESFAERNILWQQGKPTEWPIHRRFNEQKSFRLIDFGRSRHIESSVSRMGEEEVALRLFHLNHHG